MVFLILLVSAYANISSPVFSQGNTDKIKMKIVSTTEQAGIMIKTETTLYIDGQKEARYITETRDIKMLNKQEVSNKHTFFKYEDGFMYSIDLDKRTGVKTKNLKKEFLGDMTKAETQQFGKEVMDMMKATTKNIGTKVVAGKTCQLTVTTSDLMGMKTEVTECKYKDYTLESTSNSMGVIVKEEVIYFEENASIPAEAFQIEKGIKMTSVNY